MIPQLRDRYNQEFTNEKYQAFLHDLDKEAGYPIDFRIAESPLFIPADLITKILQGAEQIIGTVTSEEYFRISDGAIPAALRVPNETDRPTTIAVDFAVCKDAGGNAIPQLIEMQAFPSLFCYQTWLAGAFRKHFHIDPSLTHLFHGLSEEEYIELLRRWIVAEEKPENVVLLEIEPEKQKTRVDFELTKYYLGLEYVCISKVIREGKNLFYEKNGKRIPIHRIYNRVIFDELVKRTDLHCQFNLTEEVEVQWVCHPNWFFRISKFSLPYLKNPFVPPTYFLNELTEIPRDLENYVLKPLFSFAGTGVYFDVTREVIDGITDRKNYILQRKVNYEPVLRAADEGMVKTEIRVLFLWPEGSPKPQPVISVIRLSRGKMIGVDFNKNKTWVGGTVGFFPSAS
jgi:hypothetical protein